MATVTAIVEMFGVRREITFVIGSRTDLFTILDKIAAHGVHVSHKIVWSY